MNAAKLWPVAIVGVLVVTVAANGVLLLAANDRRAASIEPDYYRKAVAYDSTIAQEHRDAELGWRLDAALAPARDGATARVQLSDASGAALAGATVRVEAIHNADPGHPVRAELVARSPGEYQGALRLRHRGLWELRFEVTHGAERFTADLRRELGAEGVGP